MAPSSTCTSRAVRGATTARLTARAVSQFPPTEPGVWLNGIPPAKVPNFPTSAAQHPNQQHFSDAPLTRSRSLRYSPHRRVHHGLRRHRGAQVQRASEAHTSRGCRCRRRRINDSNSNSNRWRCCTKTTTAHHRLPLGGGQYEHSSRVECSWTLSLKAPGMVSTLVPCM
jgi:hypothetical protein